MGLKLTEKNELKEADLSKLKYFSQYPLSAVTQKSLKANGFTKLTDIQKLTLKHALLGEDVVVEAPTGSGKTLAFVVPLLEQLVLNRVSTFDGPVAVILTPTRELCRQITLVLKRFASFHRFTMLDIMGGKSGYLQRQEWSTVARANIIVGTPGRFVQHQTENPILDMSSLQMLILDEADRLLDSSFKHDLNTILDNLTPDRQTLLFSATQTSTLDQLVRVRMRDPKILSSTCISSGSLSQQHGPIPIQLFQSYAVVPLDHKLDVLWTFLQSHCKKKIIVFFSTQKQVRFVYELFQQLRPYFRLLQLRGNMHQLKRFQVYDRFAATTSGCVLLATNVAERGLDFPTVDWVVQVDCPHQLDDYIHRVGRTARFGRSGRAITFLLPSEVAFIDLLSARNVVLKLQKFPESQINHTVSKRSSQLLAGNIELATAARSAFTAYVRDYCLGSKQSCMTDTKHEQSSGVPLRMTDIFDPAALPLDEFATSLGLPSAPDLPKSSSDRLQKVGHLSSEMHATEDECKPSLFDAMQNDDDDDDLFLRRKSQYVRQNRVQGDSELTSTTNLLDVVDESSSGEEEEKLQQQLSDAQNEITKKASKRTYVQLAKSELRRNVRRHVKIEFDEEGVPAKQFIGNVLMPVFDPENSSSESTGKTKGHLDVEHERQLLRNVIDRQDRKVWSDRIRERKRAEKRRLKQARKIAQSQVSEADIQMLDIDAT